ncbi:MAG: competence/damage-inducible protein A [Pseudomonadota bacterium]
MKIYVVTTGDEILQGIIIDSNSAWISEKCALLGHEVAGHISVGDNLQEIGRALRYAASQADCIIVSGGLGPTSDDLTLEAAAQEFHVKLKLHQPTYEKINNFFEKIGRPIAQTNRKQALIPEHGKPLYNDVGTAPGIQVNWDEKEFFFLPGVPIELYQIFEDSVFPWLKQKAKTQQAIKILRCFGLPEATIAEKIEKIDLFESRLSFRVKFPEILLKLIANNQQAVEKAANSIKEQLGNVVYAEGNDELASVVGRLLVEKSINLAVAESCTGGLLSSLLTDVAGSSKYFERGVVTYSNTSKQEILKVPSQTIADFGAVSKETALAMAQAMLNLSNTDLAISVTGIAGPSGGTEQKPVGLIFMAYATKLEAQVFEHKFQGNRERIKLMTAMTAIDMVRKYLLRG